jgi:hypothetical protein
VASGPDWSYSRARIRIKTTAPCVVHVPASWHPPYAALLRRLWFEHQRSTDPVSDTASDGYSRSLPSSEDASNTSSQVLDVNAASNNRANNSTLPQWVRKAFGEERPSWSPVAPVDSAQATERCPGAFVTLLSGQRWLAAATCLAGQLKRFSRCPRLIVHDDMQAEERLSTAALRWLAAPDMFDRVINASTLRQRVLQAAAAGKGRGGSGRNRTGQQQTGATAEGRRLLGYHTPDAVARVELKYLLWALVEYDKLVYLDLDTLVLHDLDRLLWHRFDAPIAAVPASCSNSKQGGLSFNSGLFIFRPSFMYLASLVLVSRFLRYPWRGMMPAWRGFLLLPSGGAAPLDAKGHQLWTEVCAPQDACNNRHCLLSERLFPNSTSRASGSAPHSLDACRRAHHGSWLPTAKQCEKLYTDQTCLNIAFRRRWHALPHLYNLSPRNWAILHDAGFFETSPAAVVHFAGEPKPWNTTHRRFERLPANLIERWRTVVSDVCPNVSFASLIRGAI